MLKIANKFVSSFGLVFVGWLLALKFSYPDFYSLFILFFAYIALGSSAFFINDYFDYEYDRYKKRQLTSKNKLLLYAILSFAAGIIIAMLLPQRTFYLLLIAYAVTFVYSAPPFRFKEKAVLDFTFHGLVGPLLILTGYSVLDNVNAAIIAIAVPQFFFFANSSLLQEMRDVKADRRAGFSTTVIRFKNPVNIARAFFLLAAASFAAAVYFFYPLYFLLIAASFIPYYSALFVRKDYYEAALEATNKAAIIFPITGAIVFYLYLF